MLSPAARPERRRGGRGEYDHPSRDRSQGGVFLEEDQGEENAVNRLERADDARCSRSNTFHPVDEKGMGGRGAEDPKNGDEGPIPPGEGEARAYDDRQEEKT